MPAVQTLLKPAAAAVKRCDARFRVLVAGRRFGKSRLSEVELLEQALKKPGSRSVYMAPSRVQAKQILWAGLKERVPASWIRAKNETALTLTLNNGSIIQLAGADYSDSLRGISADLIVLDEYCFIQDLENQMAALRPMLSTTKGRMLLISTPAGGGTYSQELFERAKSADNPGWQAFQFTSVDGGWIPESEVEAQRATMDELLFKQEYYAGFMSLLGACYPQFSTTLNVSPQTDDGGPLVVGMDFNVSPFCAVVLRVRGNTVAVIDEIELHQADTAQMAKELLRRFGQREITVCPDPTGSRKQTSSLGLSDHAILKQHGLKVKAPRAPWRVTDKLAVTRFYICSADGHRALQIDPRCKQLIRSLKSLEFDKNGKNAPDKSHGHDHFPDSLGYSLLALKHGLLPYSIGSTSFSPPGAPGSFAAPPG